MTSCTHIDELTRLQPPKLSQSVHREECTQCFDDQDEPSGIDLCLSCFNGGCLGEERHHARTHVQKTGHVFTINIQRKPKPSAHRAESEEPPAKITKLAIVEERDEDKYDTVTTLRCWKCDAQKGHTVVLPPDSASAQHAAALVDGVMKFMSSAQQSEVKAWEEDIVACEHTLTLQQSQDAGHILPSGLAHCGKCELKENLWLCMTCGSLGCGRQQYGGKDGNGHGLQHFQETGHNVSVKLGTITSEGNADIYCYTCNDSKLDPEIAFHLSNFGINVVNLTKTEKSMTEINLEFNLKYDFSLVGEDGKALDRVFGPGLTGLSNLGNSCYMASVLQTLFALPAFQSRYYKAAPLSTLSHAEVCTAPLPADCLECQMQKVADGLLSGRYSHPSSHVRRPSDVTEADVTFQKGLRPMGFKALVGKGHAEFATMRQQDSEEFLAHLVEVLRRDARRTGMIANEPTQIFAYGMEQRLQCRDCLRVRYRVDKMDVVSVALPAREKPVDPTKTGDGEPKKEWEDVDLKTCLDTLTAPEGLEYACPSCGRSVIAIKNSRFATVPDVLVVHAKKFQLVNWVPTKLDIPLILPPSDEVTLDAYVGHGLQAGEVELPDDNAPAGGATAQPTFDAGAMTQLQEMGFPEVRCQRALLATGNSDAGAAMEWLFAHMDDPDIDDPIQPARSGGQEPSAEQVAMLADMGFTAAQARKALRETSGDMERAVEWLFSHPDDTGEESHPVSGASSSGEGGGNVNVGGTKDLPARYRLKAFISHKGPSVHSGHYVAHIRVGDDWVLFNDEKVVKADGESVEELKKLAYLYVFEKL